MEPHFILLSIHFIAWSAFLSTFVYYAKNTPSRTPPDVTTRMLHEVFRTMSFQMGYVNINILKQEACASTELNQYSQNKWLTIKYI